MKIETITQQQILDRMGSDATEVEADEMRLILINSGLCDTDEITDREWNEMIQQAVMKAKE